MTSTRIERAIDEMEADGDDFESSCDDVRLAWLAHEQDAGAAGNEFEPPWSER